jgi:two-component system response regulator NreC
VPQIRIALFAEQQTVVSKGLALVLKQISDVDLAEFESFDEFLSTKKTQNFNILFLVLNYLNDYHFDQIKELNIRIPDISIIIIPLHVNRDTISKAIKSGAKGFISTDAPLQEIREAVYSIRNGHDFFSSTITNLLVSNYVEVIRSSDPSKIKNIDILSKRELEILTLWGEGLQNVEIASRLFISIRTVETHKNNIMQKLGIRTQVDLLKFAIRNNLIAL